MVRLGKSGLAPEDLAKNGLSLQISIAHKAKCFGLECLERLGQFDFLARLRDPSVLVPDINADPRLCFVDLQPSLTFRLPFLLPLPGSAWV